MWKVSEGLGVNTQVCLNGHEPVNISYVPGLIWAHLPSSKGT